MDEMKDNQIWFDFVLHEIIWFISQSLNVDRRAQAPRKREEKSPKEKLGKFQVFSLRM